MKKLLFSILAIAGICLSATSCWDENIPEAGAARHQVTDLKGVPGDEEAQLSWTMPEGWNPTEYIITYTNGDKVTERTTEQTYTVSGLTNDVTYTFDVQAVYGDLISGAVSTSVKPATTRFPVADLAGEGSDAMVILSWTRPATTVLSYTLTYYKEGADAESEEVSIEADKESYTIDNLENDVNYTFSLVANYAKGASEPAVIKAMPTLAIPYFLDRTAAAVNQPIKFTFNTEGYPSATNIRWTFPDGKILTGTEVSNGISSAGTQQITLTAHIGDKDKSWTLEVQIREYVVDYRDWKMTAKYNGFKGTCPVFSPDGKTVYIITFNGVTCLYAFDLLTGENSWVYEPASVGGSYNMLTVNPVTGDIYFGAAATQFYCVKPDGTLRWSFDKAGAMKSAAPAVSKDGTVVYVGDQAGNIYALDAVSGSQKWSASIGTGVAAMLVNGNELVAGSVNGIVKFYNISDGSEIKTLDFGTGASDVVGFAVGNDKRTAYFSLKKSMSSFDLETKEIIVKSFAVAENNLWEPVVAPNGNVYVAGKDNSVYCLDKDLTQVIWKYDHEDASGGTSNAFNYSHPCVDTENRLYITSGQAGNVTYIFNQDGTIKESYTYGSTNPQKQMGGNNYIDGILFSAFVGANGENGAFFGKYVGGERASSWSSHGGDICGSCCIK